MGEQSMNSCKRIIGVLLGIFLTVGVCTSSVSAAGKVGDFYSDTTADIQRVVGDKYLFSASGLSEGDTYTVGNGKVLSTYTVEGSTTALGYDAGQKNPNVFSYVFGFHCIGKGETGIYIRHNGKAVRLFKVKVNSNVLQLKQALGTNPAKYTKVKIHYMCCCKMVTDQQEIWLNGQRMRLARVGGLTKSPFTQKTAAERLG
jgi:hypothetical protein